MPAQWPYRLFAAISAAAAVALSARAALGSIHHGIFQIDSPLAVESVFAVSFLVVVLITEGRAVEDESRGSHGLLVLALIFIAIAFSANLRDPFLNDDYALVNRSSLPWHELLGTPANDGSFRPLGNVYFALIGLWAHHDPLKWHLAGLGIHLVNCALLYAIAWTLWKRSWLALVATLLFGLHATRPEVVTWTAGSFDLLACGFILAAALGLFRGKHIALILVLLAAAVLSKESAYAAPFVIAALAFSANRWREPRMRRFLALSVLLCAILFAYRWHVLGGMGGYIDANTGRPMILSLRLLPTLKGLFVRIWAILIFPFNWDAQTRSNVLALGAPLICSGFALMMYGGKGVRREISLPLLTFTLCAALPVIHLTLIGQSALGSRVLYLPSVGFCLLLAHLLMAMSSSPRRIVAAVFLFAGMGLGLRNNLQAWHRAAVLADQVCSEAARDGVGQKPPEISNGVYFFANGFRECVEDYPKNAR